MTLLLQVESTEAPTSSIFATCRSGSNISASENNRGFLGLELTEYSRGLNDIDMFVEVTGQAVARSSNKTVTCQTS